MITNDDISTKTEALLADIANSLGKLTHPILTVSSYEEKTLRDEFAMAALNGLLSYPGNVGENLAKDAYYYADKMLEERKR